MSHHHLEVVQELFKAANDVHDAAKTTKNCKDSSRKISRLALEISTSVDNTLATVHTRGEGTNLPVSVLAALGAARDVFSQCAEFMREVASKGVLSRHFTKGLTADTIGGYLAAVEGLRELLKIDDNSCGLLIEPFAGLGVDTTCTKEALYANVTCVDAAYDGLKTMLNLMVNITDGLQWPLKAAPQTFLYILNLFEDCRDIRNKIATLLCDVQDMWLIVEDVSCSPGRNELLLPHLSTFFEILQRIAIRLHVVLRIGRAKRAMAIHTVVACLELEKERLNAARNRISLTFQGATLVSVNGLCDLVQRLQNTTPTGSLISDMSVSATLPPMPDIFHGRGELVKNAVELLTGPSPARLALLGSGGMGKTTVALAVLHNSHIISYFGPGRIFISCEALVDADSFIVSLAKVLRIQASTDLLTAVIAHLAAGPRTLLVIDNLETVWLAQNVETMSAVERLLATLASVPSVSLIITCRGNVLPPHVRWTNAASAALSPLSLNAAVDTLQDTKGSQFTRSDAEIAEQLVRAVDMMPLAVTLLGQLAQRGTPVSELLESWNLEHSALLQIHGIGRINNIEVSIELSIAMLRAADQSQESLHLLSLCAMLPDGLHPDVFAKLRPYFKNIRRARELLSAYALANLGADRVLKTLSPVRHLVLDRYPAQPNHHNALCSIYFHIASKLPMEIDEHYRDLAAAATLEMGNLGSLLLTLVQLPSQSIVDSVIHFTSCRQWQQPTVTLALALLPHLDQHPLWKAGCSRVIGRAQYALSEFRSAIDSLTSAAQSYLDAGDLSLAAMCKCEASNAHRLFGEYESAEVLLEEARVAYAALDDDLGEARCRHSLGSLMTAICKHDAAIEHIRAAQRVFASAGTVFEAAQCTEALGILYRDKGDLRSAATELEASRREFHVLGDPFHLAQSSRFLGCVLSQQGDFVRAEQLLSEAEQLDSVGDDKFGLAMSAWAFGYLRRDQRFLKEAIFCFESAQYRLEALGNDEAVAICKAEVQLLSSEAQD